VTRRPKPGAGEADERTVSGYAVPQQAYAESAILTAPPGRLVVMLYDGAIRFLTQGAIAMKAGERERARNRISRAEAIIDELNVVLDMSQGEISERLRSIYLFSKRHLREASLHQQPSHIEAVARLLRELRESWDEVARRAEAASAA
jgi:flagellar secretion chaperone FliS